MILPSRPLVSIITPTFQREAFLPAIAACVTAQTCQDIEWLVLDDSETPSAFLAGERWEKLRYIHAPERLSIGEKRNRLVDAACGEIVVHFDDDDYYGPDYIGTRLKAFAAGALDVASLSGFFAAHLDAGLVGYCWTLLKRGPAFRFDRQGVEAVELDSLNIPSIHLCYGWSYVYRRSVWSEAPFNDSSVFEDRDFMIAAGNKFRISTRGFAASDCVHSIHAGSSSRCFPQRMVPEFGVASLSAEAYRHICRLRGIAHGDASASTELAYRSE